MIISFSSLRNLQRKSVCLRRPVTNPHRQTPCNTTPACEGGMKRRETHHPAFNKPLPQPSQRVTHTSASASNSPSVQHERVKRTRSKHYLDTTIASQESAKSKPSASSQILQIHHFAIACFLTKGPDPIKGERQIRGDRSRKDYLLDLLDGHDEEAADDS